MPVGQAIGSNLFRDMGKIRKDGTDQSVNPVYFLRYFREFVPLLFQHRQKDPCPRLIDLGLRQSALARGGQDYADQAIRRIEPPPQIIMFAPAAVEKGSESVQCLALQIKSLYRYIPMV